MPSPSAAVFLHIHCAGHLCYCQKTDSFITNTSTLDIECYKYQVLHSSSGSEEKEDKSQQQSDAGSGSVGGMPSSCFLKGKSEQWAVVRT